MKKNQNFLLILLLLVSTSFCLNGQSQAEGYEHEILISFTNTGVSSFGAEETGCLLLNEIPNIDLQVWCVKDTLIHNGNTVIGLDNIIEYFESFDQFVRYAEPNYRLEIFEEPNDTHYDLIWGLPKINASEAWGLSEGSEEVVVAVFDTGIDWAHPDLIDNIWQNLGEDIDGDGTVLEWSESKQRWVFDPGDENGEDDDGNGKADDFVGWNFVEDNNNVSDECENGHGTHVSGILGAIGNNNKGVIGACPNVKLMTIKIFSPSELCRGNVDGATAGLYYAVEMGADISNHSYGTDETTITHREAILSAEEHNHLFIAAAGNFSENSDAYPRYPASYEIPNVISVGASNQNDKITDISNFGEFSVDLFAPGIGIYSTMPADEDYGLNSDGEYDYKEGTSMASPHVAGVAALIKATCEDADYLAIKEAILNSVDVVPGLVDECISDGRLNAFNALNYFEDHNECELDCSEYGLPCDDGNPETNNDTVNEDCICEGSPIIDNCLRPDSLALVAFYKATNGPEWSSSWDLSEPVSEWFGVTLSEDGCNVICIDLDGAEGCQFTKGGAGNGLEGTIPVEISELSRLKSLFLGNNVNLTGSIPSELGNLSKLEDLFLTNNSLSGVIPSELGSLGSLICLNLSYNELSGKIPDGLENLFNLEKIYLNSNNLEGCYPELCKVVLGDFDFSDNPAMANGGSDDGFIKFCNGIGPCRCKRYVLFLGPNRYTCGMSVRLTTNVPNAESTTWIYNGEIVGSEETIEVYLPGIYTVTVTNKCGDEFTNSIEVIEANGCVWPGDANYDGFVDIYDGIPMQRDRMLGMNGAARKNATTDWIGQPYDEDESWDRDSFFEVNDIHSDANGDGKLNDDDHDVIKLNYGKRHKDQALSRPALPNGFMVTQELANQELAMASSDSSDDDKFVFNLILKQDDINALGVGCKINLGENKVKHAEFVYNSDFFGDNKPFYHFDKENNNLDIAIAIAKEDRFVKGGGIIGKVEVIYEENIESFKLEDIKMKEVVLVDEKEQTFKLNGGASDYSSMVDINYIELKAGWNLISFDIIPYDLSLKSVFRNLKSNNLEQVVAYNNGAFVFDPNIDDVFNTMDEYMPGLGYWVKVKEDDFLALPGFVPQELRPGKLNLGWNLIGFQSEETCLARLYFEELGAADNPVQATTSRGENIVYDPLRDWDSSFNALEKGNGMWLKTEKSMNGGSDEIDNSTNVFEFIYGECNLPKGEKIIVKDSNGLARGSFTVLDGRKFKTNAVYGDDPRTVDLMEGIPIGSSISFSWRNQVLEDVHVFNGDMGFEYLKLEFSLEEEDINLPETLEVNLFPNPVVNEVVFNVNFFNPTEEATVDIYNFSGSVIFSFKENIKGAVIGEFRYDLSDLPLGRYLYKVSNKEYSYSNSFIKID